VDIFTAKYFFTYLGTYYPVIVPATIGIVLLAAALLDWLRVGIMGYADDFETPILLVFLPFLHRLLFGASGDASLDSCRVTDTNRGRSWGQVGEIRCKSSGIFVATHGYWDSLVCSSVLHAEKLSKELKGMSGVDRAIFTHNLRQRSRCGDGGGTEVMFVTLLGLLGIAAVLLAYKFIPMITVGLISAYITLRATRAVVRLSKKLKAHIANPKAHTETESNGPS